MPITAQEVLSRSPLFRGMPSALLEELAAEAEFVDLLGANELFSRGSMPDSLYLVVTGRIRVEWSLTHVSEAGVGDSVGETSVLSDQPRMGRAVALRDSRLLRLQREQLIKALMHFPQGLLAMSQIVVNRLQGRRFQDTGKISNIAILETRPGRGSAEAVRRISQALSRYGTVATIDENVVNAALGAGAAKMPYSRDEQNWELVRWLNQTETDTDYLVYTTDGSNSPWLRRCLRQADHVILLADVTDSPKNLELTAELQKMKLQVPVDVLFRRDSRALKAEPVEWLQEMGAQAHYYWHGGRDTEIVSMCRQLLGRGVGLVLGGGGARGFAHIGLIRALDEMGIQLDLFGGSSMGALIAAFRANGLSAAEIASEVRASFVDRNFLNDYTLPRVSLIRGRRFLRRMRSVFGDLRIEDLPAPFFCVTTNLTRGRCEVHRSGSLATWTAVSMAVPGVAPPVAWHGDFLCDGAVINALPTDVMRSMGRGRIIGSSVSSEGMISAPGVEGPDPGLLLNWTLDSPRPSLFDILFRTATLTSESGNAQRANLADVYLRMPVSNVGMFEWGAIDSVVRMGYEHAIRELADLRDQLIV